MKRIIVIALLAGCTGPEAPAPVPEAIARVKPVATPPTPINVIFTEASTRVPTVESVGMPTVPGAAAIWGATGRDHRGHVYVGVSCEDAPGASAHVLCLDAAGTSADLGGVVEKLQQLGLAKEGERQNKIHTKLLQAADGEVYFASLDEHGEVDDGTKLPQFGSHLWRLTPGLSGWQHLGHRPEGIIASAVGGRFVYFLGYYGHTLLQYDTRRQTLRSVNVGSVGGHVSRNFLADDRGHAYVPRVTKEKAELVEYDDELHEVKAFPLSDYSREPDATSHGIVSVAALKEGAWLFSTDRGRLYRLDPRSTGTTLTDLGMLHPQGQCYAACLFSLDGETQVVAIANTVARGEPKYDWVTFDLRLKRAKAVPLPFAGRDVLVYGSITRDEAGRCYVGGRQLLEVSGKLMSQPALWRATP